MIGSVLLATLSGYAVKQAYRAERYYADARVWGFTEEQARAVVTELADLQTTTGCPSNVYAAARERLLWSEWFAHSLTDEQRRQWFAEGGWS